MRFSLLIVILLATAASAAEPAYTTPKRPALPTVKNKSWCRTPVDRFILSGLEEREIQPSPAADRRTLIRRVSFDLTGLPPTPGQVQNFLNDRRPDAYERMVDQTLASPQYGARWGQHWLDVVRYADSDGFEYDDPRPNAWRYRDWVIRSFNEDKPFSKFVSEQIAADELYPNNRQALAALGLHRLGPLRLNAGMQDVAKNRQEVLTEMTDIVGSAFLGLTLGCARCHDHKFDPVTQADYYRIQSFFAATSALNIPLVSKSQAKSIATTRKQWLKQVADLKKKIDAIGDPARATLLKKKRAMLPAMIRAIAGKSPAHRTKEQQALLAKFKAYFSVTRPELLRSLDPKNRRTYQQLHDSLASAQRNEPPQVPAVMGVADQKRKAPDTFVLFQGNPHRPTKKVLPTYPESFQSVIGKAAAKPTPVKHLKHQSSGRRSSLAKWLASSRHPLTYRVFANRVWQHHFGRGIVSTPNDFGEMGAAATHPDLLDWLAIEFAHYQGRIKPLHRMILLSATYRQASQPRKDAATKDPNNEYFWRMNRRRLESEVLRDSVLAISGQLNLHAGGPGVRLPLSKEIAELQYKGVWTANPNRAQHVRRTVFVFLKRNNRPPLLESFDSPNTMQSCGRRSVSVHAGQALTLLNGEFSDGQATAFAQRLLKEHRSSNLPSLVRAAYQLALTRNPKPVESQLAERFLVEQQRNDKGDKDKRLERSLSDLCLVLFNLDEFLYVE